MFSPDPHPPSAPKSHTPTPQSLADRQTWMGVLAIASLPDLEQHVTQLAEIPAYHFLRSPEIGLTMVRGRAGGTGQPFNLGEMTITRCVIQLEGSSGHLPDALNPIPTPITGFGYVAGRSHRHAELVALCDALLQHPDWHDQVHTQVIEPLQQLAQAQRQQDAAEVESTRVNFFTLMRGENP